MFGKSREKYYFLVQKLPKEAKQVLHLLSNVIIDLTKQSNYKLVREKRLITRQADQQIGEYQISCSRESIHNPKLLKQNVKKTDPPSIGTGTPG